MIHEAQLIPKAGYVEVEIDGVRKYQKIVTQDRIEREEADQDRDELIVDLEYRLTLVELGIV